LAYEAPDPRHFLGWNEPALPAAVRWLAGRYAGADDVFDLSRCLLVLPGARAGRRLKELLAEESAGRGLRLVPPRVTTTGGLPEYLYEPGAPLADPALCLRLWLRALRDVSPAQRALVFPDQPEPGDLRGWLALAREVEGLHEKVSAAGLRFRDVHERCAEGLLFDDGGRWRVLARVQDAYAALLTRAGVSDRMFARMHALQTGAVTCAFDVCLIGAAELPALVRRMLEALDDGRAASDAGDAGGHEGSGGSRPPSLDVLVHAPATAASSFDPLGCVLPGPWAGAHVPVRDDQLQVVGHPASQAAEVVRALAGLRGRYAADDVVIGVPDPDAVPYIEQRLAAAGAPTRYGGGTSLPLSRPYRLLSAVADLLGSGSYAALGALARHPDLGAWLHARAAQLEHEGAEALLEGGDWLTPLDSYLADRLPSDLHAGLGGAGGKGRAVVDALLQALFDERLLGGLGGRAPLGEWMARIMDLLVEVYGAAGLGREEAADRRALAACMQLRAAAAAHHEVPGDLDDACDAAAAIRILLDDVRGGSLPAEAGDAAIEMLGWLELHLDDAPVAVLTGMNEPFVPEAINADNFLPDALCGLLGLEDNARRYARDAYQLTAILHSRPEVRLVAGRRTADGDPLRPSRLLLALSGPELALRIRRFLEAGAPSPSAEAAAGAAAPERETPSPAKDRPSAFLLPPEPVLRLDPVPDALPVTAFASLIGDPYRFALDRTLGRDSVDDSARELDPRGFGSLAHAVVQHFGTSRVSDSSDAASIAAYLDRRLDHFVAERFGRSVLPAFTLQVEQLRLRLRAFAHWQAGWAAAGWRIVGVECGTPESGVAFDVDGTPIRLRGRIDRIDHNPRTGAWAVFDYKTGEEVEHPEKTHRRKGEWTDLQLPLYRWLLPFAYDGRGGGGKVVFTGGHDASVRLGYIALGGDPDVTGALTVDWTADEIDGALEAARAAVRVLRANTFSFERVGSGWLTDDLAALLGKGRLESLADDDESSDEAVSP